MGGYLFWLETARKDEAMSKSKKIGKEFIVLSLDDIYPYGNNPRFNEDAVPYVVESIKQCTDLDPIEVDENNVVLSGHTRLLAMQQLGYKEADCIRYTGLTEAQKKKYRLLANKVAEKSFWDNEKLKKEIDDLDFEGFDFDFDLDFEINEAAYGSDSTGNPYTTERKIPQYDVKGDNVELEQIVNDEKVHELIKEIEQSDVSESEKMFLKIAACRHYVFNYKKIAEYYAKASEEMQELMERSALVIIDYNNAIANGYVKLSKKLEELRIKDA